MAKFVTGISGETEKQNTIANNITPCSPTHPGTVLKDEIEYRKISQRKLAAQMNVSYTVLNEILNAKRPVSAEFALLVEAVLNIDAETLTNMQARYNLQTARKDESLREKLNNIRKIAAIL